MKNKEKFANKIIEIACGGDGVAVNKETREVLPCCPDGIKCSECLFLDKESRNCSSKKVKIWAESEYIESSIKLKKGDIVKHKYYSDRNPLKYQVVFSTYSGKGANTIDYMGDTNSYDYAKDDFEIVGHMKEYDDFMEALENLTEYKEDETK